MVMLSKGAHLSYTLNGSPASSPEDIESTEILASFNDESVQANITATNWTFYGADAVTIRQHITDGNIFEGLQFGINAYNQDSNVIGLDGFLDLTNDYVDTFDIDRRVSCSILKSDGLNIFFNQLSALSFPFLESKAVFVAGDYQDCKYVVQKKVNIVEELTAGLILFLMVKELATAIKEISDTIADGVAHTAGGITGAIAGAAFFVAKLAIQIAYAASILAIILDLAKDLFDTLNPPVRTHKTLKLSTAMEKVCTYMGYGFNTTILDLDLEYYLPSNPRLESAELSNFLNDDVGTPTGIPNTTDPNYFCSAFFETMKKTYHGKFAVLNGVLEFHEKGSPFWISQSTYVMPSVIDKPKAYNTGDLVGDLVISMSYDLQDEYTVDNQTGRIYEIQTSSVGTPNQKANLVKGFEEVSLNYCLGEEKTELLPLEVVLQTVGGVIDGLVNFFGGNSNFGDIDDKLGMLKQSSNWTSLPKIVKLQGDKLHPNYREDFSCQVLYEQHYAFDSFYLNNFGGQKEVYDNVRIPFGLEDFNTLINNSYFKDQDNRNGKIKSIKWNVLKDFAHVDYWIYQPYTDKLIETYISP